MPIPVTFLQGKRPDRKSPPHEGEGTVELLDDRILLVGTKSRTIFNAGLGCVGFIIGLAVSVAMVFALQELADWDIMRVRKGPVLVAMVALFVAVTVGGALIGLGERIIGRKVTKHAVMRAAIEGLGTDAGKVALLWTENGRAMWAVMVPGDGDADGLIARLRGLA